MRISTGHNTSLAKVIKALIDINSLVFMITKDKEVIKIPNELEEKYQFIKGLY